MIRVPLPKPGYPDDLKAGVVRIYGSSVNGVMVYDPKSKYKVGDVVRM